VEAGGRSYTMQLLSAGTSRGYRLNEFLTSQSAAVRHNVSGIWGQGPVLSDLPTPDHSGEECVLHPNRDLPVVRMLKWMAEERPRPAEGRRGRSAGKKPCFSWNDGKCTFPGCRFDHICARRHGNPRQDVRGSRHTERPRERGTEESHVKK